ncbi:hypothetical protein K435DRAFT_160944 [Dendrothele bispora CBS 962.96]|uniref:Uncharacterized protein n=1 Tax=Dendrothele bispora (strain CBS 962.96) TaxID=1314807 RepID=A0A4S8MPP5_DENBC|nr:hypothetical protein K435DRAFT_160944 [Dendrothele bispora CBS 962.96]
MVQINWRKEFQKNPSPYCRPSCCQTIYQRPLIHSTPKRVYFSICHPSWSSSDTLNSSDKETLKSSLYQGLMARIFLSFLYLSCYLFTASTSMGIRRDAKLAQNATTVQTTKIAVAPPQPPTSPPEPIPAPSIGNSIPSSPPSTLDSGSVPPSEALSSSVPSNSLPVPSSVTFSDFQGPSSTENTSFVDTQVLTEAASSFTPFTSVESPLPTLETSSSFSAAFM